MLGAMMIGTLEQSLFRLGISEFWRDAMLGLLILLAVASDAVILQRLRAALGARELKLVDEPSGVGFRKASRDERLDGSRRWETLMLALLVAIVVLNSVYSPYYLSVGNIVNLFQFEIEKSIVALTMALYHHRRRNRSFGRLGHGARGLRHGLHVPSGRADAVAMLAGARVPAFSPGSTTRSGSPMSACRRSR